MDTFKETCPPGSIIVIESVFYGGMRSSRCLYFDNPHLNCYANVQPYLERLCNGSAECSIRAGDDMMRDSYSERCQRNLLPYLDVFYACAYGTQPLIHSKLLSVIRVSIVWCSIKARCRSTCMSP